MQQMDDLAEKIKAAEPMSDEALNKLNALKEKLMAENPGQPVEVTMSDAETMSFLKRKLFGAMTEANEKHGN